MRLLKFDSRGELTLTKHFDENVPCCAILPHTWGADDDEVTFNDLQHGFGKSQAGHDKIRFCGERSVVSLLPDAARDVYALVKAVVRPVHLERPSRREPGHPLRRRLTCAMAPASSSPICRKSSPIPGSHVE